MRSVRTQSQLPRGRAQPVAGPSGHTQLWLGLGPPTPASHASPETQLLPCLRLSKGHAGPSRSARMPSRRQTPWDGAPRGGGPVCSASIPPDCDSRLPRPPPPTFGGKDWGGAQRWAHPLPPARHQRAPPPPHSELRCGEYQAPLPCGFVCEADPKHSWGSPASKTPPDFSLPGEIPRTRWEGPGALQRKPP